MVYYKLVNSLYFSLSFIFVLNTPLLSASSTVKPKSQWYKENEQIEKFKGKVERNGSTLKLNLFNGKSLELKDDLIPGRDREEDVSYRFFNYFPDLGFYLVWQRGYEWRNYLMISADTGETHELQSVPDFNENNSFILTFCGNNHGFGSRCNFIELWKVSKYHLKKVFTYGGYEVEEKYWGPMSASWRDDVTIDLVYWTRDENNKKKTVQLTNSDDKWILGEFK